MILTVNLWSRKKGEIKRFLENYYDKEVDVEEGLDAWAYVCRKPLEAVDIISAVVDNNDKYQIAVFIQMGTGHLLQITADNHNNVIKDIFNLFYKEITITLN